jgi:hypothetical protein
MKVLLISAAVLLGLLQSAAAQEAETPPLSDEERVGKIIFMNENGLISVSYDAPWFYEVPEYAMSFAKLFHMELDMALEECQSLKQELGTTQTATLGATTEAILSSLLTNNSFTHPKLFSSLLTKYSLSNKVDPESTGSQGEHRPLAGDFCTNSHKENFGVLEHMFIAALHPRSPGGSVWNVRTCDKSDVVLTCLGDVANQHLENKKAAGMPANGAVELEISTRFAKISSHPIN